jgi:hypothetical protein
MGAPLPPDFLGVQPPLLAAPERDALRAAAWFNVSGEVDSRQIQLLSAQVYMLTQFVRFLSDINWANAIQAGTLQTGGGGAAPPPPPPWPPA